MLEVRDLSVAYGKRTILRNLSFSVSPGRGLAILGTNGAGKTTLLRCMAGLLAPNKGSVSLEGEDVTRTTAWHRARAGLILVPEGHQVFASMTVAENLEVGGLAKPGDPAAVRRSMEEVYTLFPRLKERRGQAAGTLSGGERQMLAIGRGLLGRPKLLMLDEPSHGLSPILVEQMAEAIRDISKTVALIVTEQNLAVPRRCAQEVVVLADSTFALRGPAEDILDSPLVQGIYLGSQVSMAA